MKKRRKRRKRKGRVMGEDGERESGGGREGRVEGKGGGMAENERGMKVEVVKLCFGVRAKDPSVAQLVLPLACFTPPQKCAILTSTQRSFQHGFEEE